MTLNHYQRLFVHYLLGDAKDDPVKAARMAGYTKPESAAGALLRSKTVCGYLEQKLEEAGALPVAEILARLSSIASLDVMEFVDWREDTDKNGDPKLDAKGDPIEKPFLDLKKIKKLRKGNLIKDLKIQPSGAIEINFHNAVDALDKLAKYRGLFKERIEIEHLNGDASSERVNLLVNIITQQSGAIAVRDSAGEIQSSELRNACERGEMEVVPSLEVGEPTSLVG